MERPDLVLGTMTFGESVFSQEADSIIRTFLENGGIELDTAYVYNDGLCERILGEILPTLEHPFKISTKVNPRITGKLDADAAYKQVNESLARMNLPYVDTVYLHFPDPSTPVISVLSAMADLYDQGKYKELGLSNFPAWMVADVWHICDKHGWVKPTVYEGVYNPLTRRAESELRYAIDHFGLRFYAYNPLCGGLLTGKYVSYDADPGDGRFTHRPNYRGRYWKGSYFKAVDMIRDASDRSGISMIEAAYRWLAYHSMLDGSRGDAILIGASKIDHLVQNMNTIEAGPLPEELVSAFEEAWNITKKDSPEYFTLYTGKGSVGGERK